VRERKRKESTKERERGRKGDKPGSCVAREKTTKKPPLLESKRRADANAGLPGFDYDFFLVVLGRLHEVLQGGVS
jgi:hypothetical protein